MTQHLPISPDSPALSPEGSRFAKAHHILLAFTGLALVVWLLSGIYQVKSDEVAIVERLGMYISNQDGKAMLVEHGLHYHLPWPIDTVHKVSIQRTRTLQVKAFNEPPDSNATYRKDLLGRGVPPEIISSIFDPYLITGDNNVVHMEIAVLYKIDDPEEWLNTVAHSSNDSDDIAGQREEMFQQMAKHTLSIQLAKLPVEDVLFSGQAKLPAILTDNIAGAMRLTDVGDASGKTSINLGIRVMKADLVVARPPDRVKESFEAVSKAKSQARIAVSQAETTAAGAIINATADKDTQIKDAQAYRDRVVGAATGEANRFSQLYEQYKHSPDVTRWNVFVQAVSPVSTNADRIIFALPGQHIWLTIEPPKFDARQAGTR